MSSFCGVEIIIKVINNAAESIDLTNLTNWSNVILKSILVKEGIVDILSERKREYIVCMLILLLSVLILVQP